MAFEEKLEKSDVTIQAVIKMLIERVKAANTNVLGKQGDIEELVRSAHMICDSVKSSLPPQRVAEFERKVEIKMNAFIKAAEGIFVNPSCCLVVAVLHYVCFSMNTDVFHEICSCNGCNRVFAGFRRCAGCAVLYRLECL